MKLRQLAWVLGTTILGGLALSGGAAEVLDLTRVDRSLPREPAYKATPGYCLLVFGPKARQRVWLVLDGDTLYVDRNGNGDLTEKGERVAVPPWQPVRGQPAVVAERRIEAGDLHVGGLTHARLVVMQTRYRRRITPAVENARGWQAHVDAIWRQTGDGITYTVSLDLDPACYGWYQVARGEKVPHVSAPWNGSLVFARKPADAPVLHFGGPLTFRLATTELRRGKQPDKLSANLGTAGLGRGVFVVAGLELGPDDPNLDPRVEIAFPPRAHGQPPLTRKLRLDDRC